MTFDEAYDVVKRASEAGHWRDLTEKWVIAKSWIQETFGISSTEAIRMRQALMKAYWGACVDRAEELLGNRALAIEVSVAKMGVPEGAVA